MKKILCLFCASLLIFMASCAANHPADNHMNIYIGNDKKTLAISTSDNDKILKMLDIINNYQETDYAVAFDSPDYIVELSPVDKNNSSDQYKIWIQENKIIYLPPKQFNEPAKLAVSTRTFAEFKELLKSS